MSFYTIWRGGAGQMPCAAARNIARTYKKELTQVNSFLYGRGDGRTHDLLVPASEQSRKVRRCVPRGLTGRLVPPFPTKLAARFLREPFRESAFGFGPKVRTLKPGCTAKNRRPAKADLRFLVEATGFSPLAARPGEQPTGLFSLRRTISVFWHFVRKPLARRSRLHPQIPSMFAIHKKELTQVNSFLYG